MWERLRQRTQPPAGAPTSSAEEGGTGWAALLPVALAVFAGALLVRGLYLVEYHRDPSWSLAILDQQYNDGLARRVASGEGVPEGPWFRPPGYVLFLALLRWAFPEGFVGIRVVQAILGAATAGLTALLAGRLGTPRAGAIAGALVALYGPLVVSDAELLSPVLLLPLAVGALLCLTEAVRHSGVLWWAAAGVAGGLAAVVRPDVLPVWLGVGLGAVVLTGGKKLRGYALAGVAGLLCVLPVTVWNRVHGGEWVLVSTNGGVNFRIGNHPGADGLSVALPEKASWGGGWEDTRRIAEAEAGRALSWSEASSHFFAKGLADWRSEPEALSHLFARKLYFYWHGLEFLNSRDDYLSGHFSHVAAMLLWARGIYFPFGILGPLALVGAFVAWRRGGAGRLLVLYGAGYWLVVAAFFVTGRFRLPVVPVCAVLAALLLDEAVTAVQRHGAAACLRSRAAWAGLAVCLGLVAALNFPYRGIWKPGQPAQYLFAAGTALEQAGRHAEAVPYLERAFAEDPNLGDAGLFLADAFRAQGDFARAEQVYRTLLARQPGDASVLTWLAEAVSMQGRSNEARGLLEQAVQANPDSFDARMGLGVLLVQAGDMAGALRHLEAANGLQPNVATKTLLATLLLGGGRGVQAEGLLREAIALDPAAPRPHLVLAELLLASGRGQEAVPHAEVVLRSGDDSPRARALAAALSMKVPRQ